MIVLMMICIVRITGWDMVGLLLTVIPLLMRRLRRLNLLVMNRMKMKWKSFGDLKILLIVILSLCGTWRAAFGVHWRRHIMMLARLVLILLEMVKVRLIVRHHLLISLSWRSWTSWMTDDMLIGSLKSMNSAVARMRQWNGIRSTWPSIGPPLTFGRCTRSYQVGLHSAVICTMRVQSRWEWLDLIREMLKL